MAAQYTEYINFANTSKDNLQTRTISAAFGYDINRHRTISRVVRKAGVYCKCGGASQSVTMMVYDQLISGSTIIKQSDTVTIKAYGTGYTNDNYAETTFSGWTQAQSNAAIAAWKNGTLKITRTVTLVDWSSNNHGQPYFRTGVYSTDTLQIEGSTAPFTNYGPKIEVFDVFRSLNGVSEVPESTGVYARIKLSMNNSAGLSNNAKLRVYYAVDEDPTTYSSYYDIAATFGGLTAANLNKEKTIKIPGVYNNGSNVYFMLHFSAGEETADPVMDVAMRAAVPIMISDTNNGVAVGQFSTATPEEPKFECRWPAYLYGGIAQIGDGSGSLLELMGIQAGSVDGSASDSGVTVDYDVTFDKPYSTAPVVVVGMKLSGELATHYYSGRLSVALVSVSSTGFTARSYNYTASGEDVNIGFTWAAFGTIA